MESNGTKRQGRGASRSMSRRGALALGAAAVGAAAAGCLAGCGADAGSDGGSEGAGSSGAGASSGGDQVVYVYNWGEYIDESVIEQFEDETGIRVVYDTFETNEVMYPIIEQGQTVYDAVCPSDYMIQKMIANGLLAEIDFDNIPNIANIGEQYLEASEGFDEGHRHSVPYTWGTMGILYNTTKVDGEPTSWDVLWDEQYADDILMQRSVRDLFAVGLKRLGYSSNTTDVDEIHEARDILIEQKPLVQAYVIDQVRDKMIGGEAALGVIYSGEYLFCKEQNPDLAYVVPEEGSNLWFDSWVIPANAENKANAEAWINFLCRPDIAIKNFEYITYATPNTAAMEQIDPEVLNDPGVFATQEIMDRCEVFTWLGEETEAVYNECFNEVLAAK